jgi:hypothetical protein
LNEAAHTGCVCRAGIGTLRLFAAHSVFQVFHDIGKNLVRLEGALSSARIEPLQEAQQLSGAGSTTKNEEVLVVQYFRSHQKPLGGFPFWLEADDPSGNSSPVSSFLRRGLPLKIAVARGLIQKLDKFLDPLIGYHVCTSRPLFWSLP